MSNKNPYTCDKTELDHLWKKFDLVCSRHMICHSQENFEKKKEPINAWKNGWCIGGWMADALTDGRFDAWTAAVKIEEYTVKPLI